MAPSNKKRRLSDARKDTMKQALVDMEQDKLQKEKLQELVRRLKASSYSTLLAVSAFMEEKAATKERCFPRGVKFWGGPLTRAVPHKVVMDILGQCASWEVGEMRAVNDPCVTLRQLFQAIYVPEIKAAAWCPPQALSMKRRPDPPEASKTVPVRRRKWSVENGPGSASKTVPDWRRKRSAGGRRMRSQMGVESGPGATKNLRRKRTVLTTVSRFGPENTSPMGRIKRSAVGVESGPPEDEE